MTVKAKAHTSFVVKDGNLVSTRVETPTDVVVRLGAGLAGAAGSFLLSRKFKGVPRAAFVFGSLFRLFFVGLAAGAILVKFVDAREEDSDS